MFIQIEITTHCNYGCFYCAGRDMVQKHMEMDCFENILTIDPKRIIVHTVNYGQALLPLRHYLQQRGLAGSGMLFMPDARIQ